MSDNELLDLAFDDANSRMAGALSAFERDLTTVRTGRAPHLARRPTPR